MGLADCQSSSICACILEATADSTVANENDIVYMSKKLFLRGWQCLLRDFVVAVSEFRAKKIAEVY